MKKDNIMLRMGSTIIETVRLKDKVYRILLIDDVYTIYISNSPNELSEISDADFAAVATFPNLEAAREHIKILAS